MTGNAEIFKILFWKDSSRHRFTSCVQISWNLANRKSVKSCVILYRTIRDRVTRMSYQWSATYFTVFSFQSFLTCVGFVHTSQFVLFPVFSCRLVLNSVFYDINSGIFLHHTALEQSLLVLCCFCNQTNSVRPLWFCYDQNERRNWMTCHAHLFTVLRAGMQTGKVGICSVFVRFSNLY